MPFPSMSYFSFCGRCLLARLSRTQRQVRVDQVQGGWQPMPGPLPSGVLTWAQSGRASWPRSWQWARSHWQWWCTFSSSHYTESCPGRRGAAGRPPSHVRWFLAFLSLWQPNSDRSKSSRTENSGDWTLSELKHLIKIKKKILKWKYIEILQMHLYRIEWDDTGKIDYNNIIGKLSNEDYTFYGFFCIIWKCIWLIYI